MAVKAGFPGLYLIGSRLTQSDHLTQHFDGFSNDMVYWKGRKRFPWNIVKEELKTKHSISWSPQFYKYWDMVKDAIPPYTAKNFIPTATAGWDTSPRHDKNGIVFQDYTPLSVSKHFGMISDFIEKVDPHDKIVFIKSWNEWAEGNALEPDDQYGYEYLDVFKSFASRFQQRACW